MDRNRFTTPKDTLRVMSYEEHHVNENIKYTKERFVNRDKELRLIVDEILKVLAHKNIVKQENVRPILIRERRGMGKTWLVKHLHRYILQENTDFLSSEEQRGIISILIKCRQYPHHNELEKVNEKEVDKENFTLEDMQWFAELIGADKVTKGEAPATQTQWIINQVVRGIPTPTGDKRILVLIIDSIFEASEQFCDDIERMLLAPLAVHPNVLIIMTGRSREHVWISAELRNSLLIELKPFDLEVTQSQLSRLGSSEDREWIEKQSGGTPLITRLLATINKGPSSQKIQRWYQAIEEVYAGYTALTESRKVELRQAVKALSVIPPEVRFREQDLIELLSVILPQSEQIGRRAARDQLSYLNDDGIIEWTDGGYYLEETIRRVQLASLIATDVTTYQMLYQRAKELYRSQLESPVQVVPL